MLATTLIYLSGLALSWLPAWRCSRWPRRGPLAHARYARRGRGADHRARVPVRLPAPRQDGVGAGPSQWRYCSSSRCGRAGGSSSSPTVGGARFVRRRRGRDPRTRLSIGFPTTSRPGSRRRRVRLSGGCSTRADPPALPASRGPSAASALRTAGAGYEQVGSSRRSPVARPIRSAAGRRPRGADLRLRPRRPQALITARRTAAWRRSARRGDALAGVPPAVVDTT